MRKMTGAEATTIQLKKGLPYRAEAEQAVLGALLEDPEYVIPLVLGYLQAEDFFIPEHRVIFDAMTQINGRKEPLDIVLLVREIANPDRMHAVGGFGYLGALVENCPSAANVKYYANALRAETDRRKRILEAVTEIEDAFLGPRPIGKGFVKLADVLLKVIEDSYLNTSQGRYSGFATGFANIDEFLGGLQRGELYIVAGRPSQGKSSLCTQIAHNIFSAGGRVAFFPLEAGLKGQARNLASMAAEVEGWKLRAGKGDHRTPDETRALMAYLELQCQGVFNLSVAKTPATINAVLREMMAEHGGLDAVFIDHLQEMHPSNSGNGKWQQPRHLQIESVLQEIRTLAREFEIPVILAAQVGRAAEGREPILSEIKDSGSIEQVADVVMLIHGNDRGSGMRVVNVAKNRTGPTGRCSLHLEGRILKFTEQ